jgi:hypothetical protein
MIEEQKHLLLKKAFTNKIKLHTDNENWKALIEIFPGAEEACVSKFLLKNTALKIAEYVYSKERYSESIIFFNKARVKDPKSKTIFQSFINTVDKFFKESVEEFSKKDLEDFKQTIRPIIEFHKLKFPAHHKIIDSTEHMFRRIDYRIKFVAKDVEESKLTFRVQQIKNALYGDMTIEEVRQEYARLLVPKLRERLAKEEEDEDEKKSSKKKATPKKKKGKDDDK